jgi:chromosome segregation ATPase
MDNEQIEKKLAWLDKKRKTDAESIQRVQAQIQEVERTIGSVSKRVEDLSSELSRLSAIASRITQFDESLSKHRAEVSRQLEGAENRRTQKEDQLEVLRKSDQAKVAKSIDEVKRELEKLGQIDEQLDQQRTEDVRLNRELGELSEKIEQLGSDHADKQIRVVSLEETVSQETRKIGEALTELSGVKRKTDDLRNSVDGVEDRARKLEIGVTELKASDRERSDQLEVWTDEQRMRLVDFEKRWGEWEKHFHKFERESREIEEKIRTYDQTHRSIKQMQGQLEELTERLERRITEVSEMQRLSEERMKQEWSSFEAEETKKWSTFKLSSEERWKDHQRIHDKLSASIEDLEQLRTEIRSDLDLLVEREARKVNEIVALTREWLRGQE